VSALRSRALFSQLISSFAALFRFLLLSDVPIVAFERDDPVKITGTPNIIARRMDRNILQGGYYHSRHKDRIHNHASLWRGPCQPIDAKPKNALAHSHSKETDVRGSSKGPQRTESTHPYDIRYVKLLTSISNSVRSYDLFMRSHWCVCMTICASWIMTSASLFIC
jgi:hypothetical protein